jgi:hypothetical protein
VLSKLQELFNKGSSLLVVKNVAFKYEQAAQCFIVTDHTDIAGGNITL